MRLYIKQDLSDKIPEIHCSFLDKVISKDTQVLIIGCGYGIESSNYKNSINIDIDMDCIKFCKNRGIDNLICASADHLPIKPHCVKNILMQDVVEHFPSKEYLKKVVSEINRVSSLKSKILVISPLKDKLTFLKSIYNKIMHLPEPIMSRKGHTLHLSKTEFIKAFSKFDVLIDDSQDGAIFNLKIPFIGGGYSYIAFKK